jgi:hypothetical protein
VHALDIEVAPIAVRADPCLRALQVHVLGPLGHLAPRRAIVQAVDDRRRITKERPDHPGNVQASKVRVHAVHAGSVNQRSLIVKRIDNPDEESVPGVDDRGGGGRYDPCARALEPGRSVARGLLLTRFFYASLALGWLDGGARFLEQMKDAMDDEDDPIEGHTSAFQAYPGSNGLALARTKALETAKIAIPGTSHRVQGDCVRYERTESGVVEVEVGPGGQERRREWVVFQ